MEYKVIKVFIPDFNRNYYVVVNDNNLKKEEGVIVETEKGIHFAKIVSDITTISNEGLISQDSKIIRKASKEDLETNKKNIESAKKALNKAKNFANSLGLKMNLIYAYFSFDKSQLVFQFTADDRIDFRELAKKLAAIYKTRIELRQIGVRDKAKTVGGLGPCGRFLCCNLFLNNFESVSINMAKNQYISLKPDKINGVCGRLLCCLNYEDEQYTELKKEFPAIGKTIKWNKEDVKVISHNLFDSSFNVESKDKNIINIRVEEYESIK